MLHLSILFLSFYLGLTASTATFNRTVSTTLFFELEQLSRLVSIAYCVGSTGVHEPFECLSHCAEFHDFELVSTWSTGLIEASSAGYVVLSHAPNTPRIIVVFRGTHSFADVVRDLTTSPSEYVPFPIANTSIPCTNCTVHSGFMGAWNETKDLIMPVLQQSILKYPTYEVVLTGHSLGGAIAALAALELRAKDVDVTVTTFGEPRLGNQEMSSYMDKIFPWNVSESKARFRRVTHVGDPVPLLPFEDWGWAMHGGEIYISKAGLPPAIEDIERCAGPADERCIQGSSSSVAAQGVVYESSQKIFPWPFPRSWRLWQILFAHREYFWRIGLCFDPQWREYKPPEL